MIITELMLTKDSSDLTKQVNELFVRVYGLEGYTPLEYVKDELTVEKFLQSNAKVILSIDTESNVVLGAVIYLDPNNEIRSDAKGSEAEFRMLAVDKSSRNKGIAQNLIKKCIDLAKQDSAVRLVISTQKISMMDAQKLYQKMGFIRVANRDRISTRGIEYLVYELPLNK